MGDSDGIGPPTMARSVYLYIGVLGSDLLALSVAFLLTIRVDLEGWGADAVQLTSAAAAEQVIHVAGEQLSQTLALGAATCAALVVIWWVARKRGLEGATLAIIQSVLLLVVFCVAGSAAGSLHHKQQAASSSQLRQQQPTPSPYVVTYCSGGRCWGPGG